MKLGWTMTSGKVLFNESENNLQGMKNAKAIAGTGNTFPA